VLTELAMNPAETPAAPTMASRDEGLLRWMGHDPCSIDMLVQRSGLTPDVVSAMLLQLELEGMVASLPGGRYQRAAGG
jgi:DNA processing protein